MRRFGTYARVSTRAVAQTETRGTGVPLRLRTQSSQRPFRRIVLKRTNKTVVRPEPDSEIAADSSPAVETSGNTPVNPSAPKLSPSLPILTDDAVLSIDTHKTNSPQKPKGQSNFTAVPSSWPALPPQAVLNETAQLLQTKITWGEITGSKLRQQVQQAAQEPLKPQKQPSTPKGFASEQETSVLRLFRYAVDKLDVEKAIDDAGFSGNVLLTDNLELADAVIAIKLTRNGKHINLSQAERTALNAGVPCLIAGRKMTKDSLARVLAPLLQSKGIQPLSNTSATSSKQSLPGSKKVANFDDGAFFSDQPPSKSKARRSTAHKQNAAAKADEVSTRQSSVVTRAGSTNSAKPRTDTGGPTASGDSADSTALPAPPREKLFASSVPRAAPAKQANKRAEDVPADTRIAWLEQQASKKKRRQ